jgi:hypothetical protein
MITNYKVVIILLLFCSLKSYASEKNKPVGILINSTEIIQLNGTANITGYLKVFDTTYFESNPFYFANTTISLNSIELNNLTGNNRNKGDSIPFNLTLNYNLANLPFFPVKVEMQVNSKRLYSNEPSPVKIPFYIFFTSYNTVEIWNITDFANLKRRWLNPLAVSDTNRVYIAPSNIPVSNIGYLYQDENYSFNNDWEANFRTTKVPGLAFEVLMKAIPPDSIAYYAQFGDGADSTGGKVPMKTFTGTVTGNFSTIVRNEINVDDTIPLSGIYVVLFDRDAGYDDFLGFDFVDNEGNYSIHYNSNQSLEGNSLELFLEFRSHTSDNYKIICSNGWGDPYRVVTYQWNAPENAGIMQRNYVLSNDAFRENDHPAAFRVTHWAYNGYRYFDEHTLPLGAKLRANINAVGSFYNPYGLPLLGNLGWSTINIDYESDGTESTTYHEFGHHTMYRLQGNHFMLPHGTNGYDHTWDEENTSKIAWVEGWANFIGMVLDGAYWNEDNEYGSKGGLFTERRSNYGTIANGYRSEYYFACALYDVWDGPNKELPNNVLDGTNGHGWNDEGQEETGWQTLDDVELSFHHICYPLQQSDYPNRIHTYYLMLINHISDNTLKSDIARAFRENRVQWNAHEYQLGWQNTSLGTDRIYIEENYEENPSGLWGAYTDTYEVNYYNKNHQNQFSLAGGYIGYPEPILDNLYLGIWDNDRNIFRTADLNLPQSNFATFGQNRIYINNGNLNLGNAPMRIASLEENDNSVICIREHGLLNIDAGSILEVKPGGSFIVQSGGTIQIHGNGKILFKTGSYVCIGDNVNIILHDVGSTIEFEQSVNMGLAPDIIDFEISQSCHIPSSIPYSGSGTIIYNCTDFVPYTHTNDYVININSTLPE